MTLNIKLAVGSFLDFRIEALELPETIHELEIDFKAGDHVYTSPNLELGVLKAANNVPLMGRFTFQYSYDPDNRTITVCGTDYPSKDGMALFIAPKDKEEHPYIQRAVPCSGLTADDEDRSSSWNPRSEVTSGAADMLKRIVRTANESLIESLNAKPRLIVRVRTEPPKFSASEYLGLFSALEEIPIGNSDASAQQAIEAGDGAEIARHLDLVGKLGSTWGGEVTFDPDENFANVIGSTSDPKIGGLSWYGLWVSHYGKRLTQCSSWDYDGFKCTPGSKLLGGHIIVGMHAQTMPKGSDAVYIMPICPAHNNNDHVYMAAVTNRKGIWLKDYLGP